MVTLYINLQSTDQQKAPNKVWSLEHQVLLPSHIVISCIKDIQGCLSSVQSWMAANKLKLNPDKTEFIVFGNKRQQAELPPFFPADIFVNRFVPADTVKTWVLN